MKTVISASRRTDIPAYYLKWFMNKIEEGEINVQNPIYKKKTTQIDLSPESVEWVVFWSRNYLKFLNNRSFFDPYRLFFHFTIVSHHPVLEKINVSRTNTIKQMESLVKYYGSERIIWRYDPIVCWEENGKIISNFNKLDFELYCREFSALGLNRCYFSYVTDYAKYKKRFRRKYPKFTILSESNVEFSLILEEMRRISAEIGVVLYSCCNNAFQGSNTKKGHCISGKLLNNLSEKKIVSEAKTPTRTDCGCTRSVDIGNYIKHPCYHGCIYCYANPVWE
jgi:hypothetical protein